jgi:hypothetical protein
VKEIHVTQEMIDEAARLGLMGNDLVMAAVKKAIERESALTLDEEIRFILPDGQVVETDGSWPAETFTEGEAT